MGMPIPRYSGGEYIEAPDYCEWDQSKALDYMSQGLNLISVSNRISF